MKTDAPNDIEINWHHHIADWQESGLSQSAYCRDHELKPHRFSYWKRKLSVSSKSLTPAPNGFIQLIPDTILPSSKEAPPLCVRLPNHYAIEGIQGSNLHLAVQLIEQLP